MQSFYNENRLSGIIAILGLIALLAGLIIMLLLPDSKPAAWGILLAGIMLLALAFIIDYRRVGRAITSKRGRFSTASTVMISIFLGIIILVNAISVGNYHRFYATGVAQFTLTSQTKDVLRELESPVNVLCFFTPEDPIGIDSYITNLLNEYKNYSDKFSVEYIDPDTRPDLAREYNIQLYSTVVFESENLKRAVWPSEIIQLDSTGQEITSIEAEHAFTSAILEISGIIQKKVYFLTGHGENNVDTDYSYAKESLQDNLYKVDTLDLLLTPEIPDDCAALIIAGPQTSMNNKEIEIIQDYLDNDGWVMVMVNPDPPQTTKELTSSWGIKIEEGIIIDPSSYINPSKDNPSVPRTRNLYELSSIYFPGAAGLAPESNFSQMLTFTEEGFTVEPMWVSEDNRLQMELLCWTSEDSWLEHNLSVDEEPEFNEDTEKKGSKYISMLVYSIPPSGSETEEQSIEELKDKTTEEAKDTRLLVIGDSDFASNQHIHNVDNESFFIYSVEMLTVGKELITIERKVLPYRRLIISADAANFIQFSSIALLPLLVLIAGGVIWWRRR